MIKMNHKMYLLLFATGFLQAACTVKDTSSTAEKRKSPDQIIGPERYYTLWKPASHSSDGYYQQYRIYLSDDSLKIYNGTRRLCSGEIVQEPMNFTQYFKSPKTGKAIQAELRRDFAIGETDHLMSISNADGDIGPKGCGFPFNDFFIVDGRLFFYQNGYHVFVPDDTTPKNRTQIF